METAYEAQCRREDEFHWAFESVWRAAGRPSYTTMMEVFVNACGSDDVTVEEVDRPLLEFMRVQIEAGIPLNWFAIKANEFACNEAMRQQGVARTALLELLGLRPEELNVDAS
jgi:hypothetical protein